MSCVDKVNSDVINRWTAKDTKAVCETIAICFDELIEQLQIIGTDLENIETTLNYIATDK